jgi:hypothetical protein
LLFDEQVLCHPFIVGELASGNLRRSSKILSMLKALPEAHLVEHEELLVYRGATSLRAWYRLGGRSSSRLHAAHWVRHLDFRQAASESSGSLKRPGVNIPIEITRRWSESEKIAHQNNVRGQVVTENLRIRSANPTDADEILAIRRNAIMALAEEYGRVAAERWANAAHPDRAAKAIATSAPLPRASESARRS